jgi:nucleoside phosphorylase/tetratricopeptide (TPR) repeat protein
MTKPRRLAVIITALPLERDAVLAHLRNITEEPPVHGSIYRRGIFDERSDPWDVIVAEIGAGNIGAGAEAVRVITHYSPNVALFVGVAGGIKDVKHGDVVASTKVYGYESGKDEEDGFKTRPAEQLPSYRLEQRARFEAGEQAWLLRIKGPSEPGDVPNARVGPIAAGEKVVASNYSATYKFLRKHYGDAVVVEMEGHGFLLGVRMSEPTQGIVIRGVSDLVEDKHEANDDKWQPIAARNAAAFAFQVLSKLTPEESGPSHNAPPAQQINIGDISGNNNTLTIQQHQGVTADELVRLIQTAAPDANSQIDAACARMKAGEPDIAIHMLTEMQKHRWDRLTSREKYRVVANLGHAFEQKGEFRKAAQFYLDAKRHQPLDEKARSFEAIAHYHVNDKARAFALSEEILIDHPNCSIAIAIRIRSAPPEITVEDLEQSVPAALREEVDILHALSWRALNSGNLGVAERVCLTALKHHSESVELKEQLAAIVVQLEGRAKQANQPICTSRLENAVEVLTASLNKNRGPKDASRLRHTRAEAYDLLGKTEDAETDFRTAIEGDRDNPGIVRRFVLFLESHGRTDTAIEVLRQADLVLPEPNNRLMLACLLGERGRAGDREAGVKLLRATITMISNADPDFRAGMVATLTRLLSCLGQHDEAIASLDSLSTGFLSASAADAIRSGVLLRAGRKKEALDCAKRASGALAPASLDTDRMRVAEALGFVGEKSEALELWKALLKPTWPDSLICTALECAREASDDQFILSFCKQLREAGVQILFALELEVVTLERYRVFDQAIEILQTFLVAPTNEDLARVFRVRLALLGMRLNRPELIETDVAKLPRFDSAPVKVGVAVGSILRNGPDPAQGVIYVYELVRRHFNDSTARKAYHDIMGVGDEGIDLFPTPVSVGPGCAVKYKADDTGEEKWVILEDSADPSKDREEIGPEHPWFKELDGKVVGDAFHLRRDPIQGRTATIQAIISKYVYRKFEILDSWEERFPEIFFVRKYTSPTNEDGSPDISLLLKAIDLKEQQKQDMHALYRNNPISVTTFAKFADAGVLESLSHLATEGSLPVRCCFGTTEEYSLAEAALANAGNLVLDSSAIATLFFSGQFEILKQLAGKCVICESSLEEYLELQCRFADPSGAFFGKFKGKYLFREDDPEERQRQEKRLIDFLAKMRSLAAVKSGEKLAAVDAERRKELITLFGQPTAEAIAEAAASGAVLWTDDMAVAELAKERAGVNKRVWTQVVAGKTTSKDVYTDLTLFLLQWRYFFTRVEPDVVLAACRKALWDPTSPPLQQVIDWLCMPELIHIAAVQIAARSLPLVWKYGPEVGHREAVTRAIIKALLGRTNGRQSATAIANNIRQIFSEDTANAEMCKKVINDVLRETMGPATDGSKAAWAQATKPLREKLGSSDMPAQDARKTNKGLPAELTPKERADRRKADRKRIKNLQKKKGKRSGG